MDADAFHNLLKYLLVVASDLKRRAGTGRTSRYLLLGLLLLAKHSLQVKLNDDPKGIADSVAFLLQILEIKALVWIRSLGILSAFGFLLLRLLV